MWAKWNHTHGISNVWLEPAVRGAERLKDDRAKVLYSNHKPLRLIERIITASSAEVIPEYYALAKARIHHALRVCVSRPATDLPPSCLRLNG